MLEKETDIVKLIGTLRGIRNVLKQLVQEQNLDVRVSLSSNMGYLGNPAPLGKVESLRMLTPNLVHKMISVHDRLASESSGSS